MRQSLARRRFDGGPVFEPQRICTMTDASPDERLAALSVVPGDHHLLGELVALGPCHQQRRELALAQAEADPAPHLARVRARVRVRVGQTPTLTTMCRCRHVVAVDDDERVRRGSDLTHGLGHLRCR